MPDLYLMPALIQLTIEVVLLAVRDSRSRDPKLAGLARNWLEGEGRNWIELLGADPDIVMKGVGGLAKRLVLRRPLKKVEDEL